LKFDNENADSDVDEKKMQLTRETIIDDDEPDYVKDDPLGSSRKFYWVLVLKEKRELAESFFI
jgi:hypothetical protein